MYPVEIGKTAVAVNALIKRITSVLNLFDYYT